MRSGQPVVVGNLIKNEKDSRKAMALARCMQMDILWNKNEVSLVSRVVVDSRSPNSRRKLIVYYSIFYATTFISVHSSLIVVLHAFQPLHSNECEEFDEKH